MGLMKAISTKVFTNIMDRVTDRVAEVAVAKIGDFTDRIPALEGLLPTSKDLDPFTLTDFSLDDINSKMDQAEALVNGEFDVKSLLGIPDLGSLSEGIHF